MREGTVVIQDEDGEDIVVTFEFKAYKEKYGADADGGRYQTIDQFEFGRVVDAYSTATGDDVDLTPSQLDLVSEKFFAGEWED